MKPASVTYRCHAQYLAEADAPLIFIDRSAVLSCGCTAHAGHRVDDGEAAVAAVACSERHHALIRRFRDLLVALPEPLEQPLIDVCADLLSQARRRSR